MSPVRYELGFYIPEDDNLHSHRRENLKSYIVLTCINYLYDIVLFPLYFVFAFGHNMATDLLISLNIFISPRRLQGRIE
jgi:hypothetical protein